MSIQDDLDRFTADALYVQEHRQELLQKYPERRIAVYNQEVIGAAKNLPGLLKQVKRRGIPPARSITGT